MTRSTSLVAVMMFSLTAVLGEQRALGPATVTLKRVEQCPDPELYPYSIHVIRKKESRTVDSFSGNLTIDEPLDQTMGAYINAAKNLDGGWKPNFYVMDETDACETLMKWVSGNFKQALEVMGAPPECPLAAGSYTLEGFKIDYEELPENMYYGEFQVDAYLTKAKERMLCVRLYVDIDPKKDE